MPPLANNLSASCIAARNELERALQGAVQEDPPAIRAAVVMGVSGSGKTTVGRALAERLGWEFQEGDALHPPENVAKMHAGQPLDDNDRAPWLTAVAARIDVWRRDGSCGVITCSALKRKYRDTIIGPDRPEARLVFLTAPRTVLAERIGHRQGHFMPATLLDSQLAALEPPTPDENPIIVTVETSVEVIVEQIAAALVAVAPMPVRGVENQ